MVALLQQQASFNTLFLSCQWPGLARGLSKRTRGNGCLHLSPSHLARSHATQRRGPGGAATRLHFNTTRPPLTRAAALAAAARSEVAAQPASVLRGAETAYIRMQGRTEDLVSHNIRVC